MGIRIMTEAVLLLRLEHKHFGELLGIIEQQIGCHDALDLVLLRHILDYFTDYPDQCHHPIEDLVFRRMHKQHPTQAAPVGDILQDHRNLSELTEQLAEMLSNCTNDDENLAVILNEGLRRFVDHYRAHMRVEEQRFFPMAVELLDPTDWAEIEYDLFDRVDPLYQGDVEDRFSRLRKKIDDLAKASCGRAAALREARALHQLTTIESFNDMMERLGREYRLIEHPEGAYALEHRSEGMIDIPRCSPAQAIWSAYFYVKGLTSAGAQKQSRQLADDVGPLPG